jgi:hypothetical protein
MSNTIIVLLFLILLVQMYAVCPRLLKALAALSALCLVAFLLGGIHG